MSRKFTMKIGRVVLVSVVIISGVQGLQAMDATDNVKEIDPATLCPTALFMNNIISKDHPDAGANFFTSDGTEWYVMACPNYSAFKTPGNLLGKNISVKFTKTDISGVKGQTCYYDGEDPDAGIYIIRQ